MHAKLVLRCSSQKHLELLYKSLISNVILLYIVILSVPLVSIMYSIALISIQIFPNNSRQSPYLRYRRKLLDVNQLYLFTYVLKVGTSYRCHVPQYLSHRWSWNISKPDIPSTSSIKENLHRTFVTKYIRY